MDRLEEIKEENMLKIEATKQLYIQNLIEDIDEEINNIICELAETEINLGISLNFIVKSDKQTEYYRNEIDEHEKKLEKLEKEKAFLVELIEGDKNSDVNSEIFESLVALLNNKTQIYSRYII